MLINMNTTEQRLRQVYRQNAHRFSSTNRHLFYFSREYITLYVTGIMPSIPLCFASFTVQSATRYHTHAQTMSAKAMVTSIFLHIPCKLLLYPKLRKHTTIYKRCLLPHKKENHPSKLVVDLLDSK